MAKVIFYYKDTLTGHILSAVPIEGSSQITIRHWSNDQWDDKEWTVHIEFLNECVEIPNPEKALQTESDIKNWLK